MLQHSRKPAAFVLLAVAVAAAALLVIGIGPARGTDPLEDLEVKIAQPDATPEVWRQYAQRLQTIPRYAQAAAAYRKLLDFDRYDGEAKFQCAICLAQAGNSDEFLGFMRQVVDTNPKLAVDIFNRPEAQRYADDPRYSKIYTDAQMQSMD